MTMTPSHESPAELCAVSYLALGWTPIPIEPRGKRPRIVWSRYQATRPTLDAIGAWWAKCPDANVGIVTGKLSGLVVVDLDSLAAVQEFVRRCEGSWVTPMVRTAHGLHMYFKHPGFPVPNRAA